CAQSPGGENKRFRGAAVRKAHPRRSRLRIFRPARQGDRRGREVLAPRRLEPIPAVMLKVRSLKPTIILQFAIIIAPITLVLLYQALSDVRHADSVKFELQSVALAHQARDNYKVFLNGVADAVDTGTLSNRARQALDQTRESLLALQS